MGEKQRLIKDFFNLSAPCNFEGCSELKQRFEKDLKNKKISACSECRKIIVIERYRNILEQLIP